MKFRTHLRVTINRALMIGAATSWLALGATAVAHAAPVTERATVDGQAVAVAAAAGPNLCTTSSSLGRGPYGSIKTATFLSHYSRYEGSVLVHYHRIYIEITPIDGRSSGYTQTVICRGH